MVFEVAVMDVILLERQMITSASEVDIQVWNEIPKEILVRHGEREI